MRVSLVVVLAVGVGAAFFPDATQSASVPLLDGWFACVPPSDPSLGCASQRRMRAPLPTTALSVLLAAGKIPGVDFGMDELYFAENLARIPDVNVTGRAFYTLLYEVDLDFAISSLLSLNTTTDTTYHTLTLSGINYEARAYLNGRALPLAPKGMFHRHVYNVTGGGRFNLLIEPPEHAGNPDCTGSRDEPCGQGGDHLLAEDGPTAQFMLGWDWAQAMPDRATGFFGGVSVSASGPIRLSDPAVQAVTLSDSTVELRILSHLEHTVDQEGGRVETGVLKVSSDWGEEWSFDFELHPSHPLDIAAVVTVSTPSAVTPWWPHSLGKTPTAHRHTFTFSTFLTTSDHPASPSPSHSMTLAAGLRTVDTHVDEATGGQVFLVNGERVFLVGGNWVTTDQALRFSASRERYCNEVQLHAYAGMNLIRVWGGGVAERDEFYACADELGVLVMQDFWMTGDNNGRWAGKASWPLDDSVYLSNVEDTIRRLRRFASLLFYDGGNEVWASGKESSPPENIDARTRALLEELDPHRFYISSTMDGGYGGGAMSDHNASIALAVKDGPYGMLLPVTMGDRNPGLASGLVIGFQPEVGSTSAPRYRGLLRLMSQEEAETGFPDENGKVGPVWDFHKFENWMTGGYDHVYSYFGSHGPQHASEWCAAAQLAAHAQYQNLFNGYLSHAWEWYTAVLMWKSQSPWSALRGFLYDWHLEATGSLSGTHAALGSPVSPVLDPKPVLPSLPSSSGAAAASASSSSSSSSVGWRVRVVNRSLQPVATSAVQYLWATLAGQVVARGSLSASSVGGGRGLTANAIALMDSLVPWPRECSAVCFLRLSLTSDVAGESEGVAAGESEDVEGVRAWHWLTDPSAGPASDFSALGALRAEQQGEATLTVDQCVCPVAGGDLRSVTASLRVTLHVPSSARAALFFPEFAVFVGDHQLLPVLATGPGAADAVVLPGQSSSRDLWVTLPGRVPGRAEAEAVVVEVASWNGGVLRAVVSSSTCAREVE